MVTSSPIHTILNTTREPTALIVRQLQLGANPGEMILGWEVTVWNGILLDCIEHAVVKTQEGLRCITPTRYGEAQLLFVPDPRLSFDFDAPPKSPSMLAAKNKGASYRLAPKG